MTGTCPLTVLPSSGAAIQPELICALPVAVIVTVAFVVSAILRATAPASDPTKARRGHCQIRDGCRHATRLVIALHRHVDLVVLRYARRVGGVQKNKIGAIVQSGGVEDSEI